MTNLPYLTIYKGDFLRSNVSACSIAAQGLWFRILILLHDSERTGYLCLNGEAMPSRIAAIKCAVSVDEYETLLAELKSVCAFNTSREGIIFSPEIVAQAEERSKNAERQRKFKEKRSGNGEGNGKVTPEVTEESRPSSSSTSLEEESTHNAHANFPLKEFFEAFPDVEITPGQAGKIEAEVKPEDEAAWLSTISIYQANMNPAKNQYLPDKVGNVLSVFKSERAKLEKEKKRNGTTYQTSADKRNQNAIDRLALIEQCDNILDGTGIEI